jgi:pimeloyl-ACP methyl ester carboxylesterase
MPHFHHGPIEIAYLEEGEGDPIMLVHGFASNKEINWVHPGWVSTLTGAGRRAIALDNRGHGASTKLYEQDDYHVDLMVGDVCALLDHLGLDRADVMGYSMGARVAAFMAARRGDRVRSVVLGGLGIKLVEGLGLPDGIAEALEVPSLADATDLMGRQYRAFAEQTGSDLRALAACLRGSRQQMSPAEAKTIRPPMLIAVGTRDEVAGSPHPLAALVPNAEVLDIPGRDHMLAVGDKVFKQAALAFLDARR